MAYTQEDVFEATHHLVGQTIPVHVRSEARHVILAQPEMRELLAAAGAIAVGNCACREQERNCDAPLEVCLALDREAREKITDRAWREISLEEALALLEETYRAGLVHVAYRRVTDDGDAGRIDFVCSCCTCCCWPLTALKRFDYHDAMVESAFVARFDVEACIGCGACVERCPFGAFTAADRPDRVAYSEDRCFGCGLCVATCPSRAIRLTRRGPDHPAPTTPPSCP